MVVPHAVYVAQLPPLDTLLIRVFVRYCAVAPLGHVTAVTVSVAVEPDNELLTDGALGVV